MSETKFVESSAEASGGGGPRGVKKVRGILAEIKDPALPKFKESVTPEPDKKDWGPPKLQIEFVLNDAQVLEMFDGEDLYEPKDGVFRGWESYSVTEEDAKKGKAPGSGSTYIKCWVLSAEELWYDLYKTEGGKLPFNDWRLDKNLRKGPRNFVGKVVTLEKIAKPLFPDTKNPIVDKDGKKTFPMILAVDKSGRPNHFCFIADAATNPANIAKGVAETIKGKAFNVALRELMMNPIFQSVPEYATLAENDPEALAKKVGLKIVDGKYADN